MLAPLHPWALQTPHHYGLQEGMAGGGRELTKHLGVSPRPRLTTDHSFCCPLPQGQHYEEEKRALSHEIVALNSHLLEAKVTIDKLSEDNVSVGLP